MWGERKMVLDSTGRRGPVRQRRGVGQRLRHGLDFTGTRSGGVSSGVSSGGAHQAFPATAGVGLFAEDVSQHFVHVVHVGPLLRLVPCAQQRHAQHHRHLLLMRRQIQHQMRVQHILQRLAVGYRGSHPLRQRLAGLQCAGAPPCDHLQQYDSEAVNIALHTWNPRCRNICSSVNPSPSSSDHCKQSWHREN